MLADAFLNVWAYVLVIVISFMLYALILGPVIYATSFVNNRDSVILDGVRFAWYPCIKLVRNGNYYGKYLLWWASIGDQYCGCGHKAGGPHP